MLGFGMRWLWIDNINTKVLFKRLLDSYHFYLYVFGYSGLRYTYIMSVAGVLKSLWRSLCLYCVEPDYVYIEAGIRMVSYYTLSGKWKSLLQGIQGLHFHKFLNYLCHCIEVILHIYFAEFNFLCTPLYYKLHCVFIFIILKYI